tara:strand:- start:16 stop:906 length:891 start_codon:yes stop_codon:yes gene_type:complete
MEELRLLQELVPPFLGRKRKDSGLSEAGDDWGATCVVVEGQVGSGKTFLLDEFSHYVAQFEDVVQVVGESRPQRVEVPLSLWRRIFSDLSGRSSRTREYGFQVRDFLVNKKTRGARNMREFDSPDSLNEDLSYDLEGSAEKGRGDGREMLNDFMDCPSFDLDGSLDMGGGGLEDQPQSQPQSQPRSIAPPQPFSSQRTSSLLTSQLVKDKQKQDCATTQALFLESDIASLLSKMIELEMDPLISLDNLLVFEKLWDLGEEGSPTSPTLHSSASKIPSPLGCLHAVRFVYLLFRSST